MLDIEAINEEYDYGGEQGHRNFAGRSNDLNGLDDFESGILELASKCLASMKRESPDDPVIYDNSTKETMEDQFGDSEIRDKYHQANFNRP